MRIEGKLKKIPKALNKDRRKDTVGGLKKKQKVTVTNGDAAKKKNR